MSGYLQKMVSSAAAPRAAIRPALGSLFSGSVGQRIDESAQPREQTVTIRQTQSPAVDRLDSQREAQPVPGAASLAPNLARVQKEMGSVESPAVGAGLRPVGEADRSYLSAGRIQVTPQPIASGGNPVPREEGDVNTMGSPFSQMRASGLRDKPTESAQSGAQDFDHAIPQEVVLSGREDSAERFEGEATRGQTQMPLGREPLSYLDAKRDSRRLLGRARNISEPDLSRHVAESKPEPDEIQIHIGRIEVTVVPPVPVRPVASQVRKSLKLDEYLRRGRGSA